MTHLHLFARFVAVSLVAFGGGQAALPLVERVAVVEVGSRQRDVAERRDFESAVHPETSGHETTAKLCGWGARELLACERKRTEGVAPTDTKVVECGPHADIVETSVDQIAIADAHGSR